jgi:hypothetical protein
MGGLRKLKRKGGGRYAVGPLRRAAVPGGRKLSAVILDYARPMIDNVDDDQFRVAIGIAILCWNVALSPQDDQEEQLRFLGKEMAKMAKNAPPGFADETRMWTQWLVERKKALFADDRRMVLSYTVEDSGDSHHLQVASTLMSHKPTNKT